MKRSEINLRMQEAVEFFQQQRFYLPPFAFWTPEDWTGKGPEVAGIVEGELGWDITDYGLDQFMKYGLLLFTIRNGSPAARQAGLNKPYAEKIVIMEVGQTHQMHFHFRKTEDLINRGGGSLVIQLYNAAPDESLDDTPVTVNMDGVWRTFPAGGEALLRPGESLTLTPRTYHRFRAEGGRVMMGEVSTVNDDQGDNRFYQLIGTGRFSQVEEDVAPLHLLFSDYKRYWKGREKD